MSKNAPDATIRRPVYKILASFDDENDELQSSTVNTVERYGVQVDSLVLMGSTVLTTAVVTAKARPPPAVAKADDAAAKDDDSKKLPDLDFQLPQTSSSEVELVESFANGLKHAGYLEVPIAWLDAQRQRLGYKETSDGEANAPAATTATLASS